MILSLVPMPPFLRVFCIFRRKKLQDTEKTMTVGFSDSTAYVHLRQDLQSTADMLSVKSTSSFFFVFPFLGLYQATPEDDWKERGQGEGTFFYLFAGPSWLYGWNSIRLSWRWPLDPASFGNFFWDSPGPVSPHNAPFQIISKVLPFPNSSELHVTSKGQQFPTFRSLSHSSERLSSEHPLLLCSPSPKGNSCFLKLFSLENNSLSTLSAL